jgi:hypothetical protein
LHGGEGRYIGMGAAAGTEASVVAAVVEEISPP